ncbi:hypothetical protein [Bacillus sp. FSL K6-1284]
MKKLKKNTQRKPEKFTERGFKEPDGYKQAYLQKSQRRGIQTTIRGIDHE